MEGQGAEVARAKAAAVVDDGKAHLLNGGDAALAVIAGVGGPGEGQGVGLIHLLPGQGLGRRILHQQPLAVALGDGPAPDRVLLAILDGGGPGMGGFVHHLIPGGAGDGGEGDGPLLRLKIAHAPHPPAQRRAAQARLEPGGQLAHAVLPPCRT